VHVELLCYVKEVTSTDYQYGLQLAWSVYEQSDLGPRAMDTFVYTIYFCFYFLLLVITVVALNALIALMGSWDLKRSR
jgi:hypothetical protein